MRIAIPKEGNDVSEQFGRSPSFTLAEVEAGTIRSAVLFQTPGQGHDAIFPFLREKGVACVIASGMGAHARELLSKDGVRIVLGATGPVRDVLAAFAAGDLRESPPDDGPCHESGSHEPCHDGPGGCG